MILSSVIKEALLAEEIIITPFSDKFLGPNSYDAHLSNELLIYSSKALDAKKDNATELITISERGFWLEPGYIFLGRTVETVGTRCKFVPHITGRSSVGRLGIFVHVTAGFGDVGFVGTWTLEICCVQPVKIYSGMKIAQFFFERGEGTTDKLYNGKYQSQTVPMGSKLYQDF